MSKSVKAIATLGVVAALGVAALPLSSYAANNTSSVFNLSAKIEDSLAIKIKGASGDYTNTGVAISFGTDGVVENNKADYTATGHALVTSNRHNGYKVTYAATNMAATNGTINFGETYTPNTTTSGWNFKLTGDHALKTSYDSEISNKVVASHNEAIANTGDEFEITFGLGVAPAQQMGEYSGSLTLTVAANS